MRRQFVTVLLFASLLTVSSAQDAKKDEPNKTTDVDIHFMNGSTVRMQIQTDKLEIATIYGKLAVPIRDIRSIEFGSHFPAGHADKIAAAVKKLGSGDFREREKAVAALVELGPFSYAAAVEATRAPEAETVNRAKAVVQKLQAKFPKRDLKIAAEDKVVTPAFTIMGHIVTPSLKAKTDYFGDADLSLANMRTLRLIAGPGPEVEVALDAAKYASVNQWLATSFDVDGRFPIVITAKGQVDLAPDDAGTYVVGPNGMRSKGGFGGGAPGGPGGGGKKGAAARATAGLLVGKIGDDGDPFTIGERYEGTPTQTGKLYLHINPSPYSPQSAGSYDVKAMRKPD